MQRRALLAIWTLGVLVGLTGLAGADEFVFDQGWKPVAKPSEATPEGRIALIEQDLDRNKPGKALSQVKKFLKRYPENKLCENALYLGAEAQIRRQRYWQAYQYLEKLLNTYPTGAYFERALAREYDVADAFLRGKKRIVWGIFRLSAEADGLDILRRIAERSPSSALAAKSRMRIADYYFEKGQWLDAADAYQHYVEAFRDRPEAVRAQFRAALSYYNDYRGPGYDDTPLLEAQQRFTTFRTQYPQEAARRGVSDILTQIEQARAQKDFETARFYDRVGRPGSATFYYRQVVSRYPSTDWARKSQEALAAAGAPAGAQEGKP